MYAGPRACILRKERPHFAHADPGPTSNVATAQLLCSGTVLQHRYGLLPLRSSSSSGARGFAPRPRQSAAAPRRSAPLVRQEMASAASDGGPRTFTLGPLRLHESTVRPRPCIPPALVRLGPPAARSLSIRSPSPAARAKPGCPPKNTSALLCVPAISVEASNLPGRLHLLLPPPPPPPPPPWPRRGAAP